MSSYTTKEGKLTPMGDKVVLLIEKPKGEVKTAGGLILSPDSQEEKLEALVVAVGPDVPAHTAKLIEGKRVRYDKYGYEDFKIGDKDVRICKLGSIIAVVK